MDGNKLETMPIPKLVANMSLPLMLSLLVQSLYNIVDGIYVAQLGEDAWTAISLAFPVHILMIAVGVGTGVGVNSLLSRSIGAKDSAMAEKTAATGVVLAVINAAVFMLLGLLFTNAFDYLILGRYSKDLIKSADSTQIKTDIEKLIAHLEQFKIMF